MGPPSKPHPVEGLRALAQQLRIPSSSPATHEERMTISSVIRDLEYMPAGVWHTLAGIKLTVRVGGHDKTMTYAKCLFELVSEAVSAEVRQTPD